MASKGQLTGMTGVYLVAAELSRRGFVVSPTSRSAHGVDLLATTPRGTRTLAIEVKTNARTHSFWLLGSNAKQMKAANLLYVFVNLYEDREEFFIVPSQVVSQRMKSAAPSKTRKATWRFIYQSDIARYRNRWLKSSN
jgi:hypothetical protein